MLTQQFIPNSVKRMKMEFSKKKKKKESRQKFMITIRITKKKYSKLEESKVT